MARIGRGCAWSSSQTVRSRSSMIAAITRGLDGTFSETECGAIFVDSPATRRFTAAWNNRSGASIFAAGTRFDPDYEDPGEDERFAIVCGLTTMLGGVLFTPSGLRDANGLYLIGAHGSDDDAEWP